jgi:hypothetical protein
VSGKFSTVTTITAAAAIVVAVLGLAACTLSEDRARPPLVIRNGSVVIDGGDPQDTHKHWKDWRRDSPETRRWRPVQPGGASVSGFSVTVTGAPAGERCGGGAALTGTEVFVDYTVESSNLTSPVHIARDRVAGLTDGPWEPAIDAPRALAIVPGTPFDPPELVYNPGDGWISAVTVGSTACRLARPASETERRALRIIVMPVT